MIRAFQMIFSPESVWLTISEKNRNFLFVLFFSTLPLIVGSLAIEAFAIHRFGEALGEFGRVNVAVERILRYSVTHLVCDLAFLFGGSWFLLSVAQSFNTKVGFSASFSTLAYGSAPIFLMHALDGVPLIHSWLAWGIGAGLAVRALYHGVAVNMKPEQTKGFGLFVVSIFIVAFLSGLGHFISLTMLHGKSMP